MVLMFEMHNAGPVAAFRMHNIGSVPMFRMNDEGTKMFYFSAWFQLKLRLWTKHEH